MVHEDLGFETDCPFILRVMPGISDQARNVLYPHRSLSGSRFGFFIAKRKKRRRRVRAWGRGWEGTVCNPLQATQATVFPLGQKETETRDTYADC